MKKTYIMYSLEDSYEIKDGETLILDIKKSTLNVDGKKLYDNLIKNYNKGDQITIKKDSSINLGEKLDKIVFDNINEIIETITTRIDEID